MTPLQKFNVFCPAFLLAGYIALFIIPTPGYRLPGHLLWCLGILVINDFIHSVFCLLSPSKAMDKFFLSLAILLMIAIIGFLGFTFAVGGMGGGLLFLGSPGFIVPTFSIINIIEGVGLIICRLKAS